jgi:hypothetical protein
MKLNKFFLKQILSNKRATVTTVNEFGAYPNSLLGNVINKNQKKKKGRPLFIKTIEPPHKSFSFNFQTFF